MDDIIQDLFRFVKDVLEISCISFSTIFRFNKVFAQIAITLIVPLVISIVVPMRMIVTRFDQQMEKSLFQFVIDMYYEDHYIILYITISMATITLFSILSTSVMVYTTASLNIGKDVTYLKVIKVVPRVWKRFTVTLILKFLMLFSYGLLSWVLVNTFEIIVIPKIIQNNYVRHFIISILVDTCFFGFIYLDIVSQFACVISTLETSYGIKAMTQGMHLLKGNIIVLFVIEVLFYGLFFYALWIDYLHRDAHLTLEMQVLMGTIYLVPFVFLFLLITVIQTKRYFECKEDANLEKSLLRDNLENLHQFKGD